MSSIGRTFWTLLAHMVFVGVASAQVTTIFTETMGTVSTTTTLATHETNDGFDNDSFTMSGTADVRSTTASSGYSGASASANVFFGTSGGNAKEFTIEGINTSNYGSLSLSFGVLSTTSSSAITVEVSSDGSSWTALSYTAPANTLWNLVSASGSIPSTSTLYIKFSKNSTVSWRIDDVKLTGVIINEPTTSASSITFPVVNVNDMQISWTSGDGAERIVLVKANSAVDSDPVDGTAYAANTVFGSGAQVGTGNYVVYAGSGNSVTVTGLGASTTYHVAVYEYNGSGEGANYRTTSPATGSQATDAPAGSSESDIITGTNEPASLDYATKQSASIASTSDGIRVWSFSIRDGGASFDADALGTVLNAITIGKGPSNTVTSWANTIRRAALFDGSTHVADVNVTEESISFTDLSGANVTAADNGAKTLDLYLSFESTATDNEQFQFEVTSATADAGGSQFAAADAGGAASDVSGGLNTVEVYTDQFVFTAAPSTWTRVNTNFTMTVEARDDNGNLDADATHQLTLVLSTGSGSLSSATGLTQSLVAGTYTWTDLQLNTVQSAAEVSTSSVFDIQNATSDPIEVYDGLYIENFNYAASSTLLSNGWSSQGTGSSIVVQATGLTYSSYAGSNVGRSVYLSPGGGEDLHHSFASQTSGTVYAAFLALFDSATVTGDYFFHFGPQTIGTTFRARVFVKSDGAGKFAFGISKSTEAAVYSGFTFDFGTTYLVVLKYEFVAGADNDVVTLFVNPTIGAIEPAPTVSATVATSGDLANLGAVALRQGSGSNAPGVFVDGIRVSTNWDAVPLPVQLSSFTVTAGSRGAELKWTTESEVDNAGFEVERRVISESGPSASLGAGLRITEYQKVAFIPGAGTSTSAREYSFTDAPAPGRYAYRLKQIDRNGSTSYHGEVEVVVGAVAKQFQLGEAFPNPFNPSTAIEFSLADQGVTSLKIYNVLGQEVATLFNGAAEAGRLYRATWDASGVPSGMYFARLESGNASAMKRLMLVK